MALLTLTTLSNCGRCVTNRALTNSIPARYVASPQGPCGKHFLVQSGVKFIRVFRVFQLNVILFPLRTTWVKLSDLRRVTSRGVKQCEPGNFTSQHP